MSFRTTSARHSGERVIGLIIPQKFVAIEELVRLYESGLTVVEVAIRVGANRSRIDRVLRRAGIKMRRQGPRSMPTSSTAEYSIARCDEIFRLCPDGAQRLFDMAHGGRLRQHPRRRRPD